jgi:hypothetical protein
MGEEGRGDEGLFFPSPGEGGREGGVGRGGQGVRVRNYPADITRGAAAGPGLQISVSTRWKLPPRISSIDRSL